MLAHFASKPVFASTLKIVTTQIEAFTAVFAWKRETYSSLLHWSFNCACVLFGMPEQAIRTFAHYKFQFANALQEYIATNTFDFEEL
jgi:hypothetical protein